MVVNAAIHAWPILGLQDNFSDFLSVSFPSGRYAYKFRRFVLLVVRHSIGAHAFLARYMAQSDGAILPWKIVLFKFGTSAFPAFHPTDSRMPLAGG